KTPLAKRTNSVRGNINGLVFCAAGFDHLFPLRKPRIIGQTDHIHEFYCIQAWMYHTNVCVRDTE
ncbi:MAG: hypothetical protein LWW98_04875, partial [Deltaproteobacteria bacterium]|nr:hypothetical protein [Deltaproteobacteria bacterium]